MPISPEFRSQLAQTSSYVFENLVGEGDEWDQSLAQFVIHFHNGTNRMDEARRPNPLPDTGQPPKIIFLTATTAIPYGQAMKRCWEIVYPKENTPAFGVIDASRRRFGAIKQFSSETILTRKEQEVSLEEVVEHLRAYGARFGSFTNNIVFDEFSNSGGTIRRAADLMQKAGFTDTSFPRPLGVWGSIWSWIPPDDERAIVRDYRETIPIRGLVHQNTPKTKILMQDMKLAGEKMAEQIRRHKYIP